MNPNKRVLCECGCGQETNRRFLPGHNTKIGANVGASGRHGPLPIKPPHDIETILTGFCACGCGEQTKIARQSRPKFMQFAGYPMRFVHGHHARGLSPEQTSQWKGGKKLQNGYVMVLKHGHPMADAHGYVPEHRLVVSEQMGRPLEPYEHVHHKNKDRSDNRPSNLELMTNEEHLRCHWSDPEYRSRMTGKRRASSQKPETRAKLSKATKRQWEDPNKRPDRFAKAKAKPVKDLVAWARELLSKYGHLYPPT